MSETNPLFYISIILLLPFMSPKHYSLSVSVCSGCYTKIPLPGWLINNRNLFLTLWRLGSPRSKCWQIGSGEGILPLSQPLCALTRPKGQASSLGPLLTRALIPIMRAPPSWSNHPVKALTPNTITLEVTISTYEFGGDTNVQTIEAQKLPSLSWITFVYPQTSQSLGTASLLGEGRGQYSWPLFTLPFAQLEIGRASCRERV